MGSGFKLLCIFSLGAVCATATAGADRVQWPDNYSSRYVRYHSVDKPAGKRPAKMRFFYVNPEALTQAKNGESLPDGTVLIMEDHAVKLGSDGNPVLDSNGRFIPLPEVTNVFVQEKRSGWGEAYPEDVRNGDWEYAWFLPDGTAKPDAKFDNCFACHKKQSGSDFNFTFSPFLSRIKP